MIENGIKIYPYDGWDATIWVSEGTCKAKGTASSGIMYRDNAFKPAKPWHEATEFEKSVLFAQPGEDNDLNSCINIIKLPEPVAEELSQYKFYNINSRYKFDFYKKKYGTKLNDSIHSIYDYVKCHLVNRDIVPSPSFAFNPPDLETTTLYLKYNSLVGLHIDNFDGLTLNNMETANRRLCINMGSQTRYLLFINQPVSTLLEWVKSRKNIGKEQYSQWNLYTDFMKIFPDYPVVKIPIAPNEAYIAPAENMIHDGCTEGNSSADITLYYRSNFKNAYYKNAVGADF